MVEESLNPTEIQQLRKLLDEDEAKNLTGRE
jgi:hypothetical protein